MNARHISRRDILVRGAQIAAAAGLLPGAAEAASSGEAKEIQPMTAVPFRIDIPQSRINRIMARVRDVEWPDAPQVSDPWAYGTSLPAMKELIGHWATQYDWRAREEAMNRFPQFRARIEDYDIHFIHVRGSGKNPQPIVIIHGWPNTFLEFMKVVDPLAHPEKYGGHIEDAFSVVVPSLPGCGFSSKPRKPIGLRTVGRLFDTLMTDVLGYKHYITQGGDLGFAISREIGYDAPNCKAVHLNLLVAGGQPTFNDEEKKAAEAYARFRQDEGAYSHINQTKPLTQAYGMTDSPVGTAAWIFEKFKSWAGLKNGDPWSVYTPADIIDNVMVFMATNTYGTAAWYYAAGREEPPPPPRGKLEKPTGFAHYAQDIGFWPRSFAERNYNVVRWSEIPAGGHFAAFEQPKSFIDEIRAFSRQLKA